MALYDAMYDGFGPQGWWPARTRFEMVVGAILTQNTSWTNVESAIGALKRRRLLTPERMRAIGAAELGSLIRPAGYFNIKAKRLKGFLRHLYDRHDGSIASLFRRRPGGMAALRVELLGIYGIGPETADSIMLYGARAPEFVVDAYTQRILSRHGLIPGGATYNELKRVFMENLPPDAGLYNEYHALLVKTGKDFCKTKKPKCSECPLERFLT
jgi:endonuclease-3 related protein